MILVLTGTHHQPFDRLVRAAEAVAAATGERVVVQRGSARVDAPSCEVHEWLPPDALGALADEARVIVSHGGPGCLFLAWDRGRTPVVVPRDPDHGEHVDDHQQRFASVLGDRAVVVADPLRLLDALNACRDVLEGRHATPQGPGPAFQRRFGALVDDLVRRRRARPGLRGRLKNLLRPGNLPR